MIYAVTQDLLKLYRPHMTRYADESPMTITITPNTDDNYYDERGTKNMGKLFPPDTVLEYLDRRGNEDAFKDAYRNWITRDEDALGSLLVILEQIIAFPTKMILLTTKKMDEVILMTIADMFNNLTNMKLCYTQQEIFDERLDPREVKAMLTRELSFEECTKLNSKKEEIMRKFYARARRLNDNVDRDNISGSTSYSRNAEMKVNAFFDENRIDELEELDLEEDYLGGERGLGRRQRSSDFDRSYNDNGLRERPRDGRMTFDRSYGKRQNDNFDNDIDDINSFIKVKPTEKRRSNYGYDSYNNYQPSSLSGIFKANVKKPNDIAYSDEFGDLRKDPF